MSRDIFISYVEEDGDTARALADALRAQGQSTWTYQQDGVPGISYLTQVNEAIEACRTFLLLASAGSVRAHQVIREVEQAHEREKPITPYSESRPVSAVGRSYRKRSQPRPGQRRPCF